MKYNNLKNKLNTTRISLRRLSTIFMLLLISTFTILAETETQPSSVPAKDNPITGTSYTIASTYNAGAGSAKVGAMTSKGVKFRTNKKVGDYSNAIQFTVNSGYIINGITIIGVTNTDNKAATIGTIYVDDVAYGTSFDGNVPAKNASTASNVVVTGINATSSVIFVFSDLNGTSQANLEYTITYSTAGGGGTTYTVDYDANGGTGTMSDDDSPYSAGASITVLSNSFTAPATASFSHWNTAADGSGTSYDPGDTFSATEDVTLYAQWAYPCAPIVDASCKADAWAPGIDYLKNAPATISWTCLATANSGDPTKLHYQWYRYPVGHPELAEEAEGTNDQASFTPSSTDLHDWMEYYCRVTEDGCTGHDDTHVTGAIRVATTVTGWVVFEGETFDDIIASPAPYFPASGIPTHPGTIAYEKSSSSIVDVSSKTNNAGNAKSYTKAVQLGKSTGGYFSFTIPDGYTATFTYAFSGTGNRTIMLASDKINSDEAADYIATLTSAVTSTTIEGGSYTTPLAAGTYYICEGGKGNWQICELIFTLETLDCTAPTNTSPTFGGKADYKVGDTPMLSFTASATPANGGAISYQWYQNTTGSKVGAVIADPDADGYNNRATYTPSTASPGTHFYYCVMKEEGCAKTVETDLSGIVTVSIPPTTGWILFDGEMHSEMQASPVYYYDGTTLVTSGPYMTFTTKGTLTSKDITARTNDGNYKTYTTGIQTGGTTSSSNNYLEFTIPAGYKATSFSWAFASTGNNRTIHLGTKPASVEDDLALLCTFPTSGGTGVIMSGKYTTEIPAGTYYISSLDGGACLYVDLNFTLEATCTAPTNTSPTFGGKADYKVGDTPVLSFTASATPANGGAISYQWYQNTTGSKVGAVIADPDADGYNNRATYTPSTAKAGTHFYYCVMTEAGCPLGVETALSGIVKVDGCYDTDIINATLTSASKATVTGFIGGTADVSLGEAGSGGYKMGSNGQYFMVTLDGENFQEGDIIKFTIGKASATNKLYLYSSKSAAGKFAEIDATAAGTYSYTLTASDISTYSITNTIGTYRENADNNPYMISIAVERLVCLGCASVPTITTQPTSAAICSDETHTLSVTATGASTYQWYKNGVLQSGKTAASFSTAEAGEWYCQVYAAGACYARTKKAVVTINTKVTAAWGTAPSNGKALSDPKHPTVTTNYAAGVSFSSSASSIAEVVWNDDDSRWDLVYKAEGDVTITATVTGDPAYGYCGTATVSQAIHVDAPDCSSYSFNWGTDGEDDWEVTCFLQEGSTTTWLSPIFTIPTSTKQKYYVGYMGVWNTDDAKSTDGYFKDNMPFALSPSQSKIFGRAEVGNMGGAQGRLRIYSDNNSDNKYVGFVPAGYGMRIATATPQMLAFAPQSEAWDEINWRSEVITLTADILAANYDVRLKTSDDYVWAQAYSTTSAVTGMRVKGIGDGWRATNLAAGDVGLKGAFAIFANSGDPNWYCYFIPFLTLSFDLNGGDSWSGVAPDAVPINGNEVARTVAIPSNIPVREGYKFVGWNTNKDASVAEYSPSANVTLTADTKLYAIWREIVLLPLACDDDFTGSDIAADGAFSGTHYEGGFSTNEKFYIIGDAALTGSVGGTPEQKTGSKVTINSIDFTEFIYLKGAATLDGSGVPTDRAIKFKIAEAGRLTIYFKDGKNIRLLQEDDEAIALSDATGIGYGTYGVTAGTYYIYATAGSTNIVGISFECCPAVTAYAVSEKDSKTSMCPGDNATIRLANSQTGIQYQLYKDDVLIEGSEKDGSDGNALDWAITVPGKYIVKSYDEYCPAVAMTGNVVIANPGATITGDEEMMRTESIVLTADKKGGTWALVDPADAPKLGLGTPDETDGVTSKLTVTGLKEGTVNVKYSLNGCETIHTVTVNEYIVCNSFSEEATLEYDFSDGLKVHYVTSGGKLGTGTTKHFKSKSSMCGETKYVLDDQRILLQLPQSATKLILYGCSSTERDYHGSNPVVQIANTISTATAGDFTEFTTRSLEKEKDGNAHTFTITCTGDTYLPKDKYIWIQFTGTINIHTICYSPVDCSDLIVTSSGSTTLNYNETVTLTASITDGAFTTTGSDKITLTDNGDGTATVKALSLMSAADVIVVYTRPNGCKFETPIHVNADPCPEPTVTLYTAKEQVLGTDQPLILSGIGATSTGTLSYKWYSNSIASTVGATPLTPTALSEHDYITKTAATATDTYYFLRVTNTVGGNSKSVNSDFIKITTVAACAENILIKAEVTGQNSGSVTVGEGIVSVKQSSTSHTSDGKTAWRLGSSGHYFFVSMSEGYFKNGDIVRITYVRGNGNSGGDIQLYSSNADNGQLADHVIYGTNTTVALVSKDVIFKGIPDNTINSIGVRRTSTDQQNEAIYSIEVIRPICFTDQTTCLGDVVNTQVCQLDNAAGYTYEWKVNDADAGSEYNNTTTATTIVQNIVCTIISKGGLSQGTMQIKLTGDGTAFTPSKTTYFRGETETFTPTTAGGTWSSSNTSVATIDPATGLFTAVSETDAEVTITFTNDNGCSHSETVNVTNPYFVFNATSDNNWKTIANWTYATDESTYASIGATGILPKIENRVIVKDSCVVDINDARAELVRLAQSPTQTGKLTIEPTGALTIKSTLRQITSDGTTYGSEEKITGSTISITSSEDGVGALAFIEPDNDMLPEAKVGYFFQAEYNKSKAGSAQWQYVGVPFSNPTSFHYFFYGGYIMKWNEKTNDWTQVKNNTDEAMTSPEAFKGYAFTQIKAGGYYNNSTGTLNPTKDRAWPLEITKTSAYDNTHGRNLLANSWTSPIYVNATGNGINKPFVFRKDGVESDDAIEKTFYVFNCGTYKQWEKDYKQTTIITQGSSAAAAPGQYIAMPVNSAPFIGQTTIAPMQGFFVYALEEEAELTINYELAVQNTSETTKATTPRHISARNKKENNNIRLTKITVIGETGADEAYILTGDDSFTNSFDNGWDGRKFESGTDVPYLAMLTNSGKMQVSAQPELLGTTLSFRPGNDDYYELVITTEETDLMLKDMQTNTLVQLQDTTYYPFFTDSKSMSSRFCIVKKPAVITSLDRESGSELNAFISDGEIIVSNFTGKPLDGGLYDVTGKLIQHFNAATELTTIAAPAVKGVYLIRIADQTFKITL